MAFSTLALALSSVEGADVDLKHTSPGVVLEAIGADDLQIHEVLGHLELVTRQEGEAPEALADDGQGARVVLVLWLADEALIHTQEAGEGALLVLL